MDKQQNPSHVGEKSAEQFASLMVPTPENMARMVQPMLSASASLIEINAKMWYAAAEASREWFDFIGRRLEKDAKLVEDLQNAPDPQAVVENVTQFSQRMAQDYQQEFSELSRLSAKAAGGASEVVRDATRSMSKNISSLSGEGARV